MGADVVTGRVLDFDEATITFHPRELAPGHASGRFAARLLVSGPRGLTELSVRWMAGGGLPLAAVVIPAPAPGQE